MATISLSSAGAWLKADALRRVDRVKAALVEAAVAGAEVVADAAPADVGVLRRSVHAEETAKGAEIIIDAPHAAAVEHGSRPHFPPLAPLIEWATRHAGMFGLSKDWEHAVEDLARAIAAHIGRYGTQPRWFVRNSMPRLRALLDRFIKQAVKA